MLQGSALDLMLYNNCELNISSKVLSPFCSIDPLLYATLIVCKLKALHKQVFTIRDDTKPAFLYKQQQQQTTQPSSSGGWLLVVGVVLAYSGIRTPSLSSEKCPVLLVSTSEDLAPIMQLPPYQPPLKQIHRPLDDTTDFWLRL